MDKDARILEAESRRLENRAKHTEMMNILEAGDFDTFLEFRKNKDCLISEENFSEFVEAHKLKAENRGNKFNHRNMMR